MTRATSDSLWQLAPYSRLLVADLDDDEWVVFDSGSGSTHVIDPIAARVLECIAERPTSMRGLLGDVARRFDLPSDAALISYLDSLLRTLNRKNLIQPIYE